MPDDEAQLRTLLRHAAAELRVPDPPVLGHLQRRRRRRIRMTALVSSSAVVLIALAVGGLALTGRDGSATDGRHPSTSALPGYSGPKVTATALAGYRWRSLPPAPIASRSYAAAVWTGSQLIVWGGARGNQQFADGASYDPAMRAWTKLPDAPLSAREGAVSTWVDGYAVIWGAFANPQHQATDGARYDPKTRTWRLLPPVSSAPGYSAAQLITAGSTAVLLRQHTSAGNKSSYGTTVRADAYDPRTNNWRRLPDFTGPATHQIQEVDALGVGNTAFLWSSWAHTVQDSPHGTKTTFGIDAVRIDVTGHREWTADPARPDLAGSARDPQWTGDRVLFPQIQRYCGGCAGPPLSSTVAALIDPVNGRRSRIPSLPLGAMTVIWTGGAVLEIGNTADSRHAYRTAAFDLATRRWRALAPAPTGEEADTVTVWTGRELIRWGNGDGPAGASGDEFAPG